MKQGIIALLLLSALTSEARAERFIVTGAEADPQWVSTFVADSERAYDFLRHSMGDPIDRTKAPFEIRFDDVGPVMAWTPKDGRPIRLDKSLIGSWKAKMYVLHEMVHRIRQASNDDETLWLDEGVAKFMEVKYLGVWPERYERQLQNASEFRLSSTQEDYGPDGKGYMSAFFIFHYLYSRLGGDDFVRELMRSPLSGWDNVEHAAVAMLNEKRIPIPEKYLERRELYKHFAFALFYNDSSLAPYSLLRIGQEHTPLRSLSGSTPIRSGLHVSPSHGGDWSIRYGENEPGSAWTSRDLFPGETLYQILPGTGQGLTVEELKDEILEAVSRPNQIIAISYEAQSGQSSEQGK